VCLFTVLQINATLTSLDLGGNHKIGVAGVTALASGLQTNTTLTSLNLEFNGIGTAGATALATALQTNTTLTSLDLGGNDIGDAGATALATALQTNTTLTELILYGNNICDAAEAALLSTRPRNTVHFDPNHFDDARDCCSKLLQAGPLWDLYEQELSFRDVGWLAVALGDPRVRCFVWIELGLA
jgi:hypothetical protein